jgi:hypothetical protein
MINLADLLEFYGATEEVVEEVKQEQKRASNLNLEQAEGQVKDIGYKSLLAVYKWLNNQSEYQEVFLKPQRTFLDIIAVSNEGYRIGVDIKVLSDTSFSFPLMVEYYIWDLPIMLENANIQKMILFFVSEDKINILALERRIETRELDIPSNFLIIGGYLNSDGNFEHIVEFGK